MNENWISVNERLPEDSQSVLVTLMHTYEYSDYADYSIAKYISSSDGEYHWLDDKHGYLEWDKYSDGKGGCSLYKVVAWLPLPKLYK